MDYDRANHDIRRLGYLETGVQNKSITEYAWLGRNFHII
jgi:hypothetical protein